jgi:hypothetical protein
MASGFIILYTLKFELSRIRKGAELKHNLKLTKAFEIIDQGGFICRSRSIHTPDTICPRSWNRGDVPSRRGPLLYIERLWIVDSTGTSEDYDSQCAESIFGIIFCTLL